MKKSVNNFLSNGNYQPIDVDRFIISAYVQINKITVRRNKLIANYIISDLEISRYELLQEFVNILFREYNYFHFEDLIELFEFVISPSDRVVNGAIYTPSPIREYIINEAFGSISNGLNNIKIADIACGCSGFLLTAAVRLKKITGKRFYDIFQNQIFGLDIQEYSVIRSKLLLSILALSEGEDYEEFHFNIHTGDALEFKWSDTITDFVGFEVIVGNPPYVRTRNLDESVKEKLKMWTVSHSGNPDLYIPFFQIGFEILKKNGILGFITMNSFFKSLNGRALRTYFEKNATALRIIDFGTNQVFKSKSTYTCICFLEKRHRNYIEYYKSIDLDFPIRHDEYEMVNYVNLDAKKGWNLNSNLVITKIENTGTPFGEIYRTRHGIATLRNDLYIFKPVNEDNNFFYLNDTSGTLYPIEKGICRDILNSNKLSRAIDFDKIVEKVLFPYDRDQKPKALQESFLRSEYPQAYNYLKIKQSELAKRDKGKGSYEKWFAFGRTQSLERVTNKLFFPKFSDRIPSYLMSTNEDLLFYNGQAIIGHSELEMLLIKKIMESRLFWFYIKKTSKPYSSNYYSLNGTYIKNFGIPDFSDDDKAFLINETSKQAIDEFLEDYYDVNLKDLVIV